MSTAPLHEQIEAVEWEMRLRSTMGERSDRVRALEAAAETLRGLAARRTEALDLAAAMIECRRQREAAFDPAEAERRLRAAMMDATPAPVPVLFWLGADAEECLRP